MTDTPRPAALAGGPEALWLTVPTAGAEAIVAFVHAPGENRTGNNYLFRMLADECVRAGIAVLRFDLPGCGESREPLNLAAWDRRIEEVRQAVGAWRPDAAVHWVARGLSTALLPPSRERGMRVALCPPAPEDVFSRLPAGLGILCPKPPLSEQETKLWTAIGAEPNLVGGTRVPADLLRGLASRMSTEPFDLAVVAQTVRRAGPVLRMSTADPLLRAEADRAALSVLVPQRLKEWRRWCSDSS